MGKKPQNYREKIFKNGFVAGWPCPTSTLTVFEKRLIPESGQRKHPDDLFEL
jgi:hypothetical protein